MKWGQGDWAMWNRQKRMEKKNKFWSIEINAKIVPPYKIIPRYINKIIIIIIIIVVI